jgi:hypothetical protein
MTSRLARKQGNLQLCENLIKEEILLCRGNHDSGASSLPDAVASIATLNGILQPSHLLKIERQSAKLLNANSDHSGAIDLLSSSVSHFLSHGNWKRMQEGCEMNARSLLTLVQWLQAEPKLLGRSLTQMYDENPPLLSLNLKQMVAWGDQAKSDSFGMDTG